VGKEIRGEPAAWRACKKPAGDGQGLQGNAWRGCGGAENSGGKAKQWRGGRLCFEPREEEEGEIGMVLQFPKCLGG